MAKYVISGKQGSFITQRKDAKRYYKKGDWTNATGTIRKIELIKKVRKKIRRK